MDSKQLMAIVAVIALAGAACVGAAYAFSASLDNDNNTAEIEFWKLSMVDSSNVLYSENGQYNYQLAFTAATPYDTMTEWVESSTPGTYQESIKMIWSGTTKVIGAKLSPLGYVKVKATDSDDQAVEKLTGDAHYFMTLSMENKNTAGEGTINENYDYYAGIVTPGSGTTAHQIMTHATELVYFEPDTTVKTGYTVYSAHVPVQDLENGTAVAIYAMPHDLTDLASITSEYLDENNDTNVLDGAKVTISVDSRLFSTASTGPASTADIAIQNPTTYKYRYDPTLPATAASWDLGNVVVLGQYTDDYQVIQGGSVVDKKIETKRLMAFTTELPYADNVTSVTLKITDTEFVVYLPAQEENP